MTTDTSHLLRSFLDRERGAMVRFLQGLVRVPSDNPPGDCRAIADRAAAALQSLGLAVEALPVPEAVVRAHGMLRVTNLVVRQRFGPGPTIALNAHGDVVPPGDGWTADPYGGELRDGAVYGRGAAVSKSDFATYTYALLALREAAAAGVPLAGAVELLFTFDEEAGGEIGPAWLLAQGHTRPDLAICAGFSYSIVNAHNGCLHLEVTTRGRSAHAAVPEAGADALEAMSRVLATLYAHRATLASRRSRVPGIDHPTLVVGLVSGGINTNVVPDRCRIRLDRRVIPEEDPAAVEAELAAVVRAAVAGLPGIEVEVRRVLLARPFGPVPEDSPLVATLRRHAEAELGGPVPVHGVPLYTDARHFAGAGIPTVMYGAGPRTLLEANAHRTDEHVRVADLELAARVVARTLCDLLTRAR